MQYSTYLTLLLVSHALLAVARGVSSSRYHAGLQQDGINLSGAYDPSVCDNGQLEVLR